MVSLTKYLSDFADMRAEGQPVCLVLTKKDFRGRVMAIGDVKYSVNDVRLSDFVIAIHKTSSDDDTMVVDILKERPGAQIGKCRFVTRPDSLMF